MLSALALLSALSAPDKGVSPAASGNQRGASNDAGSGLDQFQDALASALQSDVSAGGTPSLVAKTIQQVPPVPSPVVTSPAGATSPVNAINIPTATQPDTQSINAAALTLPPVTTLLVQQLDDAKVSVAAPVKPNTDKSKEAPQKPTDGSPKPSADSTPAMASDAISVNGNTVVPIEFPAPVVSPSTAPTKGNSGSGVLLGSTTDLAAGLSASPQKLSTTPPHDSSRPVGEETEAFSLNLKPKATAASSVMRTATPTASSEAGVPQNGKPTPLVADVPTTPPVQAEKGLSPSEKNTPAAAPSLTGQSSGSGKSSDGNGETAREDKRASTQPGPILGDAHDNKQTFMDAAQSPAPSSSVKTTSGALESRDPQPATPVMSTENTTPMNGAAKEVAIRLQNQAGETVNVKLTDQGGQVQVTVRSSDPVAATTLRGDLSSLTSSLEKAGWGASPSANSAGSFEPLQQARQSDRDGQDTSSHRQAEWQEQAPKKRPTTADAWDEMVLNQSV